MDDICTEASCDIPHVMAVSQNCHKESRIDGGGSDKSVTQNGTDFLGDGNAFIKLAQNDGLMDHCDTEIEGCSATSEPDQPEACQSPDETTAGVHHGSEWTDQTEQLCYGIPLPVSHQNDIESNNDGHILEDFASQTDHQYANTNLSEEHTTNPSNETSAQNDSHLHATESPSQRAQASSFEVHNNSSSDTQLKVEAGESMPQDIVIQLDDKLNADDGHEHNAVSSQVNTDSVGHSDINNVKHQAAQATSQLIKMETSEALQNSSGIQPKKPAYRMLVQRRSVFDSHTEDSVQEETSDSDNTNNALKCGYCSEKFPDEASVASHLLSHDTTLPNLEAEQPVNRPLTVRKVKKKIHFMGQTKGDRERTSYSLSTDTACTLIDAKHPTRSNAESSAGSQTLHTNSKTRQTSRDYGAKLSRSMRPQAPGKGKVRGNKDDQTHSHNSHNINLRKKNTDVAIPVARRSPKKTREQAHKESESPRQVMASVGKRCAKKNLGDEFVTFEYKRKKKVNEESPQKLKKPRGKNSPECLSPGKSGSKVNAQNTQISTSSRTDTGGTGGIGNEALDDSVTIKDVERTGKVRQLKVRSMTVLRCITCKGCFLWKWPFMDHLKVHPNLKPYECFICEKRHLSFFSLQRHMRNNHSTQNTDADKCCHSPSHSSRKSHMQRDGGDATCEVLCGMCDKSFPFMSMLSRHVAKEHPEALKAKPGVLKCKPCGRSFSDRRNLWIHQKRHPNAFKPFKCNICHRKFAMHKWLVDHVQRHNPDRNYPCGVCGKRYFTKSDAKMHEQRHTKEATFACTKCEKKFIYKSELNAHLKRHQGIRQPKNIVCEVCGKPFATRRDLERHKTVHTGEKPYKCPVCNKGFSQEINMQVHVKIHSGDRPYQCNICEKRFIAKSKLARHQQCHSTPKGMLPRPFKCVLCPRRYTAENSLIRHLKTHKHSLDTVSDIKAALNKAAEESNASAGHAGALLACMIDQAISDAKRMARHKKKNMNTGDTSLAEIIDQAIHDSKTSSSTQTPIVIENFNNTYVNIQLPSSNSSLGNYVITESTTSKGTTTSESSEDRSTSTCSDLIKLISDALTKHTETEQGFQSSQSTTQVKLTQSEPATVQTIIVQPKSAVVNPGPQAVKTAKQQVKQNVLPIPTEDGVQARQLRSLLEPSSIAHTHTVPSYQDVQVTSGSEDLQQIFVQELSFYPQATQDQTIMLPVPLSNLPYTEQQIVLSEPVPESSQVLLQPQPSGTISNNGQNILPAAMGSEIVFVPASSGQQLSTVVPEPVNQTQSVVMPQHTVTWTKKEPVPLISSHPDTKSELMATPSISSDKVRHIIVKTAAGQTFLIPSTLISLDESSQLLLGGTTPNPAVTDVTAGTGAELLDQIDSVEEAC